MFIFGSEETARRLYRYYLSHPTLGIRPVQITEGWLAGEGEEDPAAEVIRSERLRSLRNEHRVFWSVLTVPLSKASASLIGAHVTAFPRVLIVPGGDRLPCSQQQVCDGGGLSAILLANCLLMPSNRLIKHVMDYCLVITGGILCLHLIALIALLIKVTSPGPAFFAQKRIGKRNRSFWAWKFRTMRVDADDVLERCLESDPKLRDEWERNHKLKNDPRVTAIG